MKTCCFCTTAALLITTAAMTFGATFGTFNLRYDNGKDAAKGHAWAQRAPVIAGLIRFHGFDVIGTQEGLPHQMADLHKLLPDHDLVSYGRDNGEELGEHIAIFFKREKFAKLQSGRFWLSENPTLPGIGWDAALPRICTWLKLQELATGKTMFIFNIHFDHRGAKAKLESAKLLLREIKRIANETPIVMCGDFNLDQHSEGYQLLNDQGLQDAFNTTSMRYALTGTVNRFDPNHATETRIDHVFLSLHFKVQRYGILTDSYRTVEVEKSDIKATPNLQETATSKISVARLPSDHFPVLVETSWSE